MKKIATATIATAGFATFGLMQHDADAAENNNGYNPNDPYSYEYTYTIDQQGNYTMIGKVIGVLTNNKVITIVIHMVTKLLKTTIQIMLQTIIKIHNLILLIIQIIKVAD